MFVFDLFEKKQPPKDQVASRFVGGYSQNADAKAALDTAMRVAPDASTPEEALAALANQQMELNKQQSDVLGQQTNVNQQQSQQINDLVTDVRRKEKDFRDLNAQIANMPNVTAQQAAKMAQDIEAAHDGDKKDKVSVPDIVAKRAQAPAARPQSVPASSVATPEPGANVMQIAQYQKAKDQGAEPVDTTVTPAQPSVSAKTQPTQSRALGQMAAQLSTPGRVIRGRNQPTATPAAQQASLPGMGANVTQMPQTPATQQRIAQLGKLGMPVAANAPSVKQVAEAVSQADLESISTYNNQAFSDAWAHSQSTKLYYGDGTWEDLTFAEIEQIVSAIATDYTEQARPAVWQGLFTDHKYFNDFKRQHLSQIPLQFKEGQVVPMTDNETTNQAYADALEYLKYIDNARPDDPMRVTLRQDFAHKYKQRFEIKYHPDGKNRYLQDKHQSKTYSLPAPGFPLEEEPHDGKNSWSDGQGQWSSENNQISSGNNPHGFSEAAGDANTPRDTVHRYLAIDKETDVEAIKAAIHAIRNDATLKPTTQSRYMEYIFALVNKHRLPIGREYYQFLQRFMESQGVAEMDTYPHPKSKEGKKLTKAIRDPNAPEIKSQSLKKTVKDATKILDKAFHKSVKDDVAEAQTDYQKRRQRERDVDAGRPVAKQRQPKQTDYQKRRAQDRKNMELGETTNYWIKLQNERFFQKHKKAFDLVSELEQSIKDIK